MAFRYEAIGPSGSSVSNTIDAGSLAFACTSTQRENIRDIVLTHTHLDHIAGLPLFIDDLFATLTEPLRIYALKDVLEVLERDIFNWSVFPRYSELSTNGSPVVRYQSVEIGRQFNVADLSFTAIGASHKVPSSGFIVSDGKSQIAITGDTSSLAGLKDGIASLDRLHAIVVECAFPNELEELAVVSHHMTPAILANELKGLRPTCPVYVINIKPNYRDAVVAQLLGLSISGLEVMTVGKFYDW